MTTPPANRRFALAYAVSTALVTPFVANLFDALDGPRAPISFQGHESTSVTDEYVGTYTVSSFGRPIVSNTTTDPAQYRVEQVLWHAVPALVFLVACGVAGWYFGRWVSYRVMRPEHPSPAE